MDFPIKYRAFPIEIINPCVNQDVVVPVPTGFEWTAAADDVEDRHLLLFYAASPSLATEMIFCIGKDDIIIYHKLNQNIVYLSIYLSVLDGNHL
jgi:hypothetical protein